MMATSYMEGEVLAKHVKRMLRDLDCIDRKADLNVDENEEVVSIYGALRRLIESKAYEMVLWTLRDCTISDDIDKKTQMFKEHASMVADIMHLNEKGPERDMWVRAVAGKILAGDRSYLPEGYSQR